MTVPVRSATSADASALAAVHVRTWQAAYAGHLPQDYLDALDPARREPGWRTWLAGLRPPAAILVWEPARFANEKSDLNPGPAGFANEKSDLSPGPAGFVAVMGSRDPDAGAGTGEITAIYLLPGFWGQGAGRELMAAAVRDLAASGFREATLWVLDSNVRARRFYAAAGWRPDGSVKVDDTRGFPLHEVRYRRSLCDQGLRPTAP